jgi:hypothetical protein
MVNNNILLRMVQHYLFFSPDLGSNWCIEGRIHKSSLEISWSNVKVGTLCFRSSITQILVQAINLRDPTLRRCVFNLIY